MTAALHGHRVGRTVQEIAQYLALFDRLRAEAIHGNAARDLVAAVRASVGADHR